MSWPHTEAVEPLTEAGSLHSLLLPIAVAKLPLVLAQVSLTEPGSRIYQLFVWLRGSPIGQAMRGAGVWSYGVVNLIHILGVASLFGSVLILDLRLLGFWKKASLAAVSEAAVPIAKVGFCVAATAGICMISTNATDYAGNPFLLIKFPAIGLALVNALVLNRQTAWKERKSRELTDHEQRKLAWMGGGIGMKIRFFITIVHVSTEPPPDCPLIRFCVCRS